MEDIRKKIFIISGIVAGVILAVVIYLLYFNSPAPVVQSPVSQIPSNETHVSQPTGLAEPSIPSSPAEKVVEAKPAEEAVPEEYYVKQLAVIFTERFLSYSNQNKNQHVEDVLSLVTEKMAKWVSKQTVPEGLEYAGVNTSVISSNVQKLEGNNATVSVGVQREYQGQNSRIEQANGKVELEKTGDQWKVAGFFWQK